MKFRRGFVSELKDNEVFVFGSNLAGRHGKGAAQVAHKKFGAKYGDYVGRTGQCYAIPTKDKRIADSLPLPQIRGYITAFINYAYMHPELEFIISRIGCGLAGFKDEEIAPFFKRATDNMTLPIEWRQYVIGAVHFPSIMRPFAICAQNTVDMSHHVKDVTCIDCLRGLNEQTLQQIELLEDSLKDP